MNVSSFLLFSLIFFSSKIHADILFVDLNYSEKEVETARKAAKERGEKLVVYPELTEKTRSEIGGMKKEVSKLENEYEKYHEKYEKENDPVKKQKIREKQNEIANRFYVVSDKINEILTANGSNYTIDGMKKVLAKYNVDKGGFSSLVISGHHTSHYFGSAGTMRDSDIKDFIKEYPKAFDSMRGVYLWGCYTTTKEGIAFWKKNVPSAYSIAGWNGSAPKQDKQVSHDYLYKMMVAEKELSDKTTLKKAVSVFQSIPQIKVSNAAMCVGNSFVDKTHSETFSDAIACPPEIAEKIKTMAEVVKKYQEAEEQNYEDVPKNTQDSELRKIYSFSRDVEHCRYENGFWETELDRLLYLIFDRQIRKNFSIAYKNELSQLAEVLKRLGAPEDAFVPALDDPKTTRQSVLRASRALDSFERKNSSKFSEADKKIVSEMGNRVRNILEGHGCFYPLWIESVDANTLRNNVLDSNCAARDYRRTNTTPSTDESWYSIIARAMRTIGF